MAEGTPNYDTEILDYIIKKAGKSTKPFTLESRLKEDCGFDSLDGVEMTQDLEERYNREIPDEVAASWIQGKDIVAYLRNPDAYIASREITLKPKQP